MGGEGTKTGRAVPRLRISSWVAPSSHLPAGKPSAGSETMFLKPEAFKTLDAGRGHIDDISLLRTITINPTDLRVELDYYEYTKQKPGSSPQSHTLNDTQLASYYSQVIDECHKRRIECLVGFGLADPIGDKSRHDAFTKWIRNPNHPITPAALARSIVAFIQDPDHGLDKCDGISFDVEGVGTGLTGSSPQVAAAEDTIERRFSELYGTLADELARWAPPDVGVPIGHIVAITPAAVIGSARHAHRSLVDLDGNAIYDPVVHQYQAGGVTQQSFDVTSRYYANHQRVGPFWNPGVQQSSFQGERSFFLQNYDLGSFYRRILIRPMVYDGLELNDPSQALENWQYDVIRYARQFARVAPERFQLGIKTVPGTPQTKGYTLPDGTTKRLGGVTSPAHLERIAKGLLRHTSTGAALFPASVGTWKTLNETLNRSVGAPDPGTVEMQPLQAPIRREVIEKRFGG